MTNYAKIFLGNYNFRKDSCEVPMKYVMSNEMRKVKPRNGEEITLYRIRAIKDFTAYVLKRKVRFKEDKRSIVYQIEKKLIRAGDPGGFIQSEKNLSQNGSCWIDDDAFAFGQAKVCDDAYLGGKAAIGGKVKLYDDTKVTDSVQLGGSIKLYGRTKIIGTGSYFDNGVYKDLCLGKETIEANTKAAITEKEAKPSQPSRGKIRIEIEFDEKKYVNDFEF